MEKIISLKVQNVINETADAICIQFKQPLFRKLKYVSGQYLTLLVKVDGKVERRCYSLNSAPKVDDLISVTVKRIKDGKVSNHLFNTVKTGDTMKVLKPMGGFVFEPDKSKERHIVLMGAGSGITPLISMVKSALHFEPKSKVSLIYGNRDLETIIFNNALSQLKKDFEERFVLYHILSDPASTGHFYKGRIERSQVKEILESLPKHPAEQTEYFICGPSGMMQEAEEGLKSVGVDESKINIERFSAPPPDAVQTKNAGVFLETREVTVKIKGKEYPFSVKAGKSILDAALDEKIKMPYVCMDGICGSCQAKCVSGKVHMRSGSVLSKKDEADGYILTCLSQPLTNDVVLEL